MVRVFRSKRVQVLWIISKSTIILSITPMGLESGFSTMIPLLLPRDQGKNIHIHHNIFYSTGTNPSITWVGGIVASGFHDTLIENNVFDGIYHAAVVHMYHNGYSPSDYSPKGGYTTIVRNNIIVNTQKRTKDPSGTGYAVINYLPETHTFVLENNCLYNNLGR